MIVIERDICLADKGEIIIHQVNCRNKMGSGVAKAIYTKYPEVKEKYHEFCNGIEPDELLGKYQQVNCITDSRVIINMFSQLNYGRDGRRYTSYRAMRKALVGIANLYKGCDVTFAIPYGIGANLGGGDFSEITEIIDSTLKVFMVKYYKKE